MDKLLFLRQLKALSDPTKHKICELLKEKSLCACELLQDLHVTQPTLSHHMKMLEDLSLVTVRKQGTWNHYNLNKDSFAAIYDYWKQFVEATPGSGPTNCKSKR